jgi:glycosyltransferase involved in cell wall biosynthesis
MKISIIIPTIGRKTLKKVLQSIMDAKGFDKTNAEIIVIGDGNFSRDFILEQNSKHQFIKFLSTGKTSGASSARNLGIVESTGEIITFIGDDTYVDSLWLQELKKFHTENPRKNIAMLGQINWTDEFKNKSFYKWLNNWAQFSYRSIRLHGAKWHHFYTSNISIKRELLGDDRFFAGFTGWGFEDSELGYRLYKKKMNLIYNSKCIVYHDHPQTIEKVCNNFQNARKNAEIFEKLHPELKIIPRGKKLKALKIIIKIAKLFNFIPAVDWWCQWKEAWIREK